MSPSTFSVNIFPKWRTFTLRGVRVVSSRLAPLRALSYCDVVTLCAPTGIPVVKTRISINGGASASETFIRIGSPFSCQQNCASLFEPKRGHRIDASCSLRRNPNSEANNCAEEQRRNDESDRIPGFDTKEEAGQEASEPERSADAEDHAKTGKDHALTDDHVAQIRCLRSQRHAYAEFVGALLDGIRRDPIDTNGSHQQSRCRKDVEEQHIEALTRRVAHLDLAHGPHMGDRHASAG